MSDESTLSSGRFTVSPIRFYCELGRKDGLVIPLGQIGEITIGRARGLGMIAWTELTKTERADIGTLGSQILDNPFDYLAGLFDEAWDQAPAGGSLEYLAQRHCHSLNFATPKEMAFPRRVVVAGTPVRAELRSHLLGTLEEEMLEALGVTNTMPRPATAPQNELWELAA